MLLLVRNRVKDVDHWKRIFDQQADAGRAAGLIVTHVWRSVDATNHVYFLMDVEDRGRAEIYMSTPEAAAVGEEAGVIDGEFQFLENLGS